MKKYFLAFAYKYILLEYQPTVILFTKVAETSKETML